MKHLYLKQIPERKNFFLKSGIGREVIKKKLIHSLKINCPVV